MSSATDRSRRASGAEIRFAPSVSSSRASTIRRLGQGSARNVARVRRAPAQARRSVECRVEVLGDLLCRQGPRDESQCGHGSCHNDDDARPCSRPTHSHSSPPALPKLALRLPRRLYRRTEHNWKSRLGSAEAETRAGQGALRYLANPASSRQAASATPRCARRRNRRGARAPPAPRVQTGPRRRLRRRPSRSRDRAPNRRP